MRLLFLCLICLLLTLPGHAQERVRNVRIRVLDSTNLDIRYDLLMIQPGDSIYLRVQTRTRELRISPEFVRGDVGVGVKKGNNRHIIWDALANGYFLNEEIQAKVLVKTGTDLRGSQSPKPNPPNPQPPAPNPDPTTPGSPTVVAPPTPPPGPTTGVDTIPSSKPHRRYAGPAWALLSAVAPGIGNIFVQTPKPKVGLRPVVTVLCYGAAVYGLMERQKANDTYALYEQQKNMTDAEPYYQTANGHHHRYFLATRGAMIVTAADVVLTFIKGLRNGRVNKKNSKNQGVTVRPGWQAGQPTAVLQYSF